MDLISPLVDVLKFAIAAYIIYAIAKDLLKNYFELKASNAQTNAIASSNTDGTILPLRLQAYERMSLYCERIAPENLLMRVRPEGLNLAEYKYTLLFNIRQEYEHNVTQQIYLSKQLWQIIKLAGEDTIGLIMLASEGLEAKADAQQLYDVVFDLSAQRGTSGSEKALHAIKTEVAGFMG
jgi:hypothetical protein